MDGGVVPPRSGRGLDRGDGRGRGQGYPVLRDPVDFDALVRNRRFIGVCLIRRK